MLITDGLYEVEAKSGAVQDRNWLLRLIEEHAGLETETLLDTVLNEVRSASNTGGFTDDVCVLAMEVLGLGAEKGRTEQMGGGVDAANASRPLELVNPAKQVLERSLGIAG
jgi:hypothetical protein